MADDHGRTPLTAGTVTVGGSVEGTIETAGDRDWFAVELEAGVEYRIDLEGSDTQQGTLDDPLLRWLRDATVTGIRHTRNDDGGEGNNARQVFTPDTSGTYYISANGVGTGTGTYRLSVTQVNPPPETDQDPQPPAFGQPGYAFELVENADGTTTRLSLGAVSATDPDGDTLTYDIAAGNASGLFEIDSATGELFYMGSGEDYEATPAPFELTVRASDGTHSVDATVTVTVTDVEESPAPVAPEDAAGQSAIEQVQESVSEPGGQDLSADTSTAGRVAVGGSATGDIGVADDRDWFAVEFDAGRTYTIELKGRPTGDGTLADTLLHGIYDEDGNLISGTTNDDGGEGFNSRLTFTAQEGGTHYIGAGAYVDQRGTYTVAVTERVVEPPEDPGLPTGCVPETADDFAADTSTAGRIAVNGTVTGRVGSYQDVDWYAVEFEAGRTYTIELRGWDTRDGTLGDPYLRGIHDADGALIPGTTDDEGGEGRNSRTVFTAAESGTYYIAAGSYSVHVGNYTLEVIDSPLPAFAQEGYAFELAENADGSTARVSLGTVSATDPEGETLVYSIERGNASGLFGIDAASGELFYTGSGEDFEAGNAPYELTVRASDGTLSADTTVTVSVTDVAEAPAFGDASYAFELAEDADGSTTRVSLGAVSATDPEGETLVYSIEGGNASGLFGIDASSGELLYVGTGEDFEAGNAPFELTVRASDGTHFVDTTVTVSVTDVAEVPVFGQQDYAFDLAENADGSATRVSLGTVAASGPKGATLVYSIVGGNLSGSFEIDGGTSELFYIGTGEDFEAGAAPFELTVRASDGTHFVDTTVTVSVTDVAEAPVFGQQDYAFDLAENADGSTVPVSLGAASATDPEGETLVYSIEGGNASGLFGIDASSGELLYVGAGEDFEAGNAPFELTVRASDGTHFVDTAVTVSVTDVAEAPAPVTPEDTTDQPDVREVPQSVPEPSGQDFSADTSTGGRVAIGESVTGNIGHWYDHDWFAVTLEAGTAYRIRLEGLATEQGTLADPDLLGIHYFWGGWISGTRDNDGGHGRNSELVYTASEDGVHYLSATGYGGDQGTYTLSVTRADEDDYDIQPMGAGSVTVGGSAFGAIEVAQDQDWYAVELEAGKSYRIQLEGSPTGLGTLRDPFLRGIWDSNQVLLPGTSDDDSGVYRNSEVVFEASETDTYYVSAGAYNDYLGTYTLSVEEVVDGM